MSVTAEPGVVQVWAKVPVRCLYTLDLMIERGFVVDAITESMLTNQSVLDGVLMDPVMQASTMGYPRALNYLLEKGYSHSQQNSHGDTALGLACVYTGDAYTACVEVLLRHGADMYHENLHGVFPLTGAIMSHNFEVVALFVRFGTNLLANDRSGYTVVQYARLQTPENDVSQAILKILEEALVELDKKTAFAMSHHPRLGETSMAKAMDPELLRMILALL
jgi:ankyrin repeat protein